MARHWIKIYVRTGRALASVLSDREWAALTRLALYTRYRDTTIRLESGHPARLSDIARIIHKGTRQTHEIIAALIAHGALERVRCGRGYAYRVAESFAYRGNDRRRGDRHATP